MPNANAFTNGFSKGFGFNRVGGQVLIVVGSHPTYEDGDVMVAKNRRATRSVHAQHICWPRIGEKKARGYLGDTQPLLEIALSQTVQYKYERVSATECRRTNLWTLAEVVYGSTPIPDPDKPSSKLWCHVAADWKMRLNGGTPMFGVEGSEHFFGGRTDANHDKLDIVWGEIEDRTAFREVDHQLWGFTPLELTKFYALSVNDFTDEEGGELTASLVDETDPENPVTVKKRKHRIEHWRDLPDVVPDDVLNPGLQIDNRAIRKHIRSEIVVAKSL